ncbi:regulator of (H+)-ATPase in vacuolar membrane [Coemansia helicoidea]|uniref:Regulator of (H+)-ATPase in vacuolar membrane n=1 Tax=Coemansia helicoidea TaxID=1286919 RepID=A0ACC1LB26_9FUNG|nr:regulator of (H+)-ATPase in vacuolar membrane [Coemansia helicoidea]
MYTARSEDSGWLPHTGRWMYAAHIDLELPARDAAVSACAWLGEDRLILAAGSTLCLLACTDGSWTVSKTWAAGSAVDLIAAAPDGQVFATASQDCRMAKVWQLASSGARARFQYVVHTTPVRDMFWHPHMNTTVDGAAALTLYTVTHAGNLYMWNSSSADDCGRPPECPCGIRFALVGTLALAQQNTHAVQPSNGTRRLAAAGIQYQLLPGAALAGGADVMDDGAESTTATTTSSSTASKATPASGQAHGTPGPESLERTVANGAALVAQQQQADQIYAVFSDGSVDIWNVQHPQHPSAMSGASIALRTCASDDALPFVRPDAPAGVLAQSLLWQGGHDALELAMVDAVGHVFLLSAAGSDDRPLALRRIWDGHTEPIFHISVDPYRRRMATHSTEGELLIWHAVSTTDGPVSISRRMALGTGQIQTIAWAPSENEFIAATGKCVYRLVYDEDTRQWTPLSRELPSMEPYDRVFTYPAGTTGMSADAGADAPMYYISTVSLATRMIQTWAVPGPGKPIRLVDQTTLRPTQHFDRASRVMPVPYPFFSQDNIMVTFDSRAGKLRIWGIRTTPRLRWFCAKEHLLPCLRVDMIRYNSVDKAAIVSTDEQGVQTVTVWVFSSASRRSHYLPAGTIYPRTSSDRVREVRWHLTEYAQTYLGIQWDDHIGIYCQERNADSGWICVQTIHASEFGPDAAIGSFSFTADGNPTFSVGRQLLVHSQAMPDGLTLSDRAYAAHGELPLIHPFVLTELMSWGRTDVVRRLISLLHDNIHEQAMGGRRSVALPFVSVQSLLGTGADDTSSSRSVPSHRSDTRGSSRYASLLDMGLEGDVLTMDPSLPDFAQLSDAKVAFVLEKLTEVKIQGLGPIDQARLLSIVGSISTSQTKGQPIDDMGVRFLIKLQLLELENKRTRAADELSYRELNWALHSRSQAILLQICLQRHAAAGLTWESARRMGVCVWLSDVNSLRAEVESMARNIFVAQGRNPAACAIFYLALGKQRLVHGLWRTAASHPEQGKMLAFLSHDFSEARWKTAAAKNAYALLSRQRYLDAAAFFLLAGKLADAATVCVAQLKDIQLAIAICRCSEGDAGPVLRGLLWRHVLPDALNRQDRWLASLAFGLVHRYDLVQQALTDDLVRLGRQIGVAAEPSSSYSAMSVLDTELLILYRSMLDYPSPYRAPPVAQAELIAQTITIFESLGAPVMSLVVLEWWRRELLGITRKTAAAGLAAAASVSSGTLDMGAFSSFPGFGAAAAKPAQPVAPAPVDPIASGMFSMESFGAAFSGISLGSQPTKQLSKGHPAPQQATAASTSGDADANSDEDALLAVEIEDTPVQYACRVTLALQIIEFVVRSQAAAGASSGIDVDAEKRAVAQALRLPLTVFPAHAA